MRSIFRAGRVRGPLVRCAVSEESLESLQTKAAKLRLAYLRVVTVIAQASSEYLRNGDVLLIGNSEADAFTVDSL